VRCDYDCELALHGYKSGKEKYEAYARRYHLNQKRVSMLGPGHNKHMQFMESRNACLLNMHEACSRLARPQVLNTAS